MRISDWSSDVCSSDLGLGLIGGFCHLYIGQEAVAVGIQSALEVGKDSVITGYRDHGHMLAYGIDPKIIMAELTGRGAGISRGKGGSMHMFSVRSEEHTSELQSLMRISYAVFCLKKKKNTTQQSTTTCYTPQHNEYNIRLVDMT